MEIVGKIVLGSMGILLLLVGYWFVKGVSGMSGIRKFTYYMTNSSDLKQKIIDYLVEDMDNMADEKVKKFIKPLYKKIV